MSYERKIEKRNRSRLEKTITAMQLLDIWMLALIAILLFVDFFFRIMPLEFIKFSPALAVNPGKVITEVLAITPPPQPTAGAEAAPEGSASITATPTPSPTPQPPNYGLPVRIMIPKLGIDTKIQHLGLTKDGAIDAPNNMTEVGWFKESPRPGNFGSAIIDGHLGIGEYGVFQNLSKLAVGDAVIIIDENEKVIIFKVRETRVYNREERPEELYAAGTQAKLNLITCDGEYDRSRGGTPNRLIVFTDIDH